jgi:hypothetical protein
VETTIWCLVAITQFLFPFCTKGGLNHHSPLSRHSPSYMLYLVSHLSPWLAGCSRYQKHINDVECIEERQISYLAALSFSLQTFYTILVFQYLFEWSFGKARKLVKIQILGPYARVSELKTVKVRASYSSFKEYCDDQSKTWGTELWCIMTAINILPLFAYCKPTTVYHMLSF